ncbi:hypothetical protein AALO_G00147320 [Alosa alosa]|uniref:Uncharacterized protein n=1 Tax=Alosa alosa TaxID=278164 RepID=A0AAV6GE27_9TELE|nr:uncharacterized protein si:ch211-127m7.2 [Alosa alosa]KAG5273070.1 hypothetical protein AALO_G00147320 [Alosa alosa]
MANKQRELPSWMGRMRKEGDCFTKKVTTKAKKKLSPRMTVYLLNERELVQSALVFGDVEDRICKGLSEKVFKTDLPEDRIQEGINSCEQGAFDLMCARTCISEAWLDTADLETLPYGSNDQGHKSGNENCVTSILTEHPDTPSDDDALKLVREIFFK